jgi:hypothetical protein
MEKRLKKRRRLVYKILCTLVLMISASIFQPGFRTLHLHPEPEFLNFEGDQDDSEEPIRQVSVAWRAGTTTLFQLGS